MASDTSHTWQRAARILTPGGRVDAAGRAASTPRGGSRRRRVRRVDAAGCVASALERVASTPRGESRPRRRAGRVDAGGGVASTPRVTGDSAQVVGSWRRVLSVFDKDPNAWTLGYAASPNPYAASRHQSSAPRGGRDDA